MRQNYVLALGFPNLPNPAAAATFDTSNLSIEAATAKLMDLVSARVQTFG